MRGFNTKGKETVRNRKRPAITENNANTSLIIRG